MLLSILLQRRTEVIALLLERRHVGVAQPRAAFAAVAAERQVAREEQERLVKKKTGRGIGP